MDIIRIKEKKKIWFLGHRDIRPGGFQVQQCEHDCVPSCGPRGTKGGRSSETDGTFPADWPRYPQQNRSYPGWWKVQVTSRCMLDRRKSLSAPKLVIPWPIEMENGFLRFHWTISRQLWKRIVNVWYSLWKSPDLHRITSEDIADGRIKIEDIS